MKKQTTYHDPETGETYESYPVMELAKDVLSNPIGALFAVGYLVLIAGVLVSFL
jgi:hypothetical protein